MGAFSTTYQASSASSNVYCPSDWDATGTNLIPIQVWPAANNRYKPETARYRNSSRDPEETDLQALIDDFRREIARLLANWRSLHEILMEQQDQCARSRPSPENSTPRDIVRCRRRPPPRAPPIKSARRPTSRLVGRRSFRVS